MHACIPELISARRSLTFFLAAAGAGLFWALGLPLPFLFGPMGFCLAAALAHLPITGFGQVSVAARTILGVAVGASITPDVIAELPRMALSVALIPLFIAVIALVGVPFFRRLWGFDAPTAYYAAMPGGLQDMVIFGTEAGGNPRELSLIHATRVLIIVTLAPFVLSQVYGAALTNPIGDTAASLPWHEMAIMAIAAWVGWKGGERLGLFGASILGPMIVTAALSLTDVIHSRPPAEAIVAAQFFIGCGIGVHFLGVTWKEVTRVVAAGFTGLVAALGLGDPVPVFLAFAPGGQAEMTVLAIVTGADLGFVITHHLTRIVIVIVGAPVVARIIARGRPG